VPSSRAFTLLELLVVLAVISIIAAILFPVFSSVKASAVRVSCLSHFKSVGDATLMYLNDYDEAFMPVNYQPGQTPNSKTDRTWVQMLLPYATSFKVFQCPADTERAGDDLNFDQDLVAGDLYSQYYTASLHSNVGYNFQYLSPVFEMNGVWECRPSTENQIKDRTMFMFLDSVWSVQNGTPSGGGSWLVSPPCRYQDVSGQQVDTFLEAISTDGSVQPQQIYTPVIGWQPQQDSDNVYGGVWPWHQGRANVVSVDEHAQSLTINQISNGCNVQPSWTGNIFDPTIYKWYPALGG
jgi:prepilin-type N-terminal cleavage/methylation domain-containing protein